MDTLKRSFNKRAFIAIAMLMSGLILPFSGLMNHRHQFEQLTTARHFWMSVHNVSAILFMVFAILHIIYNWKSLIHYAKKTKDVAVSREALIAVVLVVLIVGLISSHAFHAR